MLGLRFSRIHYFLFIAVFGFAAVLFNAARLKIPPFGPGREAIVSGPAEKLIEASFCSPAVQNLINVPEDKIDLGATALAFASEIYPGIDMRSYSAQIDLLAEQVRRLAKNSKDPDYRIRCLNTVLLVQERFQGTRDLSSARQSERYYLNHVLATKQGNCVSMPLLYIAVAQRLGWPIYQVHVPDHSFVRYVDPKLKQQNIEATSNGGYVPDGEYGKDFLVSERGRESGAYLRTLTRRETLSDLAGINGITFIRRRDWEKGVAYLELATKLNPRSDVAWSNLTIAYKRMARHSNGKQAEKYLEMADVGSKKLDELGFVDPETIPQFVSNRRPI